MVKRADNGFDRRRYRKVFTRIWRHPKFRSMNGDEKTMALYILTGPQTNRIGLFVFSIGAAAEDLNVTTAAVTKRLAFVVRAFGWEFDKEARVIWIPSWWAWNDPKENSKAFQGALTDLNEVPACGLIRKFCQNLVGIPEALHGLMAPLWESMGTDTRSIGDRSGIERVSDAYQIPARSQEQEQEQEKEQEQEQEGGPDGRLLLSVWNSTVTTLPTAQAFSAGRLRHARARLAENPSLEYWANVFQRMDASDFLSGRKPSRDNPGWRADVDFALRPDTAAKVLEGKYDNRGAAPAGPKLVEAWVCPHVDHCGHRAMCDVKLANPAKYPVKEPQSA